jgi:gamma-glutamylcyclotransferase (GGCT)/AIG2-like uncharacterized protein YtfP
LKVGEKEREMNRTVPPEEPAYLLVYGTLLQTIDHPYARLLRQQSTFRGRGSFPGRLYDLGPYPGAVYAAGAATRVHGDILALRHPEQVLSVLDAYEGYDPRSRQSSLYRREVVEVRSGEEQVWCWVYLYNQSTAGFLHIRSGDYGKYLRQKQAKTR